MTLRIAIIGAGIGAQHLEALLALPDDFTVSLICDRDLDRAGDLAGNIAVTGKIEDVLASDADIVDICLPPLMHVPIAVQALGAGKHVVCEKPIACSLCDVDRLEAAAARAGKQVFPVFQYRYGPAMAQLRALMAAELTGRPFVATLETHWNRDAAYYAVPWRGTWAGEQGGAVLGHAIHIHDLISAIMGPAEQVSGVVATRVNPIETEDCAALSWRSAAGALVTSSVSLGGVDDRSRMRLLFEHLTAESDSPPYAPMQGKWRFAGRGAEMQARIDTVLKRVNPEPSGYQGYFLDIAAALSGRPNNAVTLTAGRASVALVSAIYKAARSGAAASTEIAKQDPIYQGWDLSQS
ncbi:Gfo/Idh/MocA family protein [Actibacterium sp. 188UL27-1]|uniref:Gfo/Idh/MocA family protein n=1 Tax=Actibacterium sp. 188UL27-1 TaxID=2786961 RepID=UPI00195AB51F|nr:Gfo/Idh/MocA family oxidoreductase [Actibacterium sp. 188UL27-1]MBM7066843.1 Gfo/Idh/MocA family oxidoreductase [Actibacterium sp. 188UL27-1]